MEEAPKEQRQYRGKRRRRDINTNQLEVRMRQPAVLIGMTPGCCPARWHLAPPTFASLQVIEQLRTLGLRGLLLRGAVWVAASEGGARLLDTLCFGNLDGGTGTASYVRSALNGPSEDGSNAVGTAAAASNEGEAPGPAGEAAAQGAAAQDAAAACDQAVRLSVDEAFFLVHALSVLCVHDGEAGGPGPAPELCEEVSAAPQQTSGRVLSPLGLPGLLPARGSVRILLLMRWKPRRCADGPGLPSCPAPAAELIIGKNVFTHCARPQALWRRLLGSRPDFLHLYLGYHHFRSKGWIPRTGLQYGVDLVLYCRHPALAHSEYSVLVVPLPPDAPDPLLAPPAAAGQHGGSARQQGGGAEAGAGGGAAALDGDEGGAPAPTCRPDLRRPALSWHDLQVANRLSAQAREREREREARLEAR